jgi:N-acetylmuramoyl-L-alanine amidase
LVETGFISNPEEEKYLNSTEGQTELSECIIKALKKYQIWLEEKKEDDKDKQNNTQITSSSANIVHTRAFLKMVEEKEKHHIH